MSLACAGGVNPLSVPARPRSTPLPCPSGPVPDSPAPPKQKVYTYRRPGLPCMTITTKSGAGVSRYLRLYRVLSQALADGRFGPGGAPAERATADAATMGFRARRCGVRWAARGGGPDRAQERQWHLRAAAKAESAASRDLSPALERRGQPAARRPPAGRSHSSASRRLHSSSASSRNSGPAASSSASIRYVGREPMVLQTTYLPEEIGGGLTRQRLGAEGGGILTVLATLGHRSARLEREFAALEADPLAADSLDSPSASRFSTCARSHAICEQRIVAYVDCFVPPGSLRSSRGNRDRRCTAARPQGKAGLDKSHGLDTPLATHQAEKGHGIASRLFDKGLPDITVSTSCSRQRCRTAPSHPRARCRASRSSAPGMGSRGPRSAAPWIGWSAKDGSCAAAAAALTRARSGPAAAVLRAACPVRNTGGPGIPHHCHDAAFQHGAGSAALRAIAGEIGETAYLLERLLSSSGRATVAHRGLSAGAHRKSFAAADPEPSVPDDDACRPRAVGHSRRMLDGSGAGRCRCRARARKCRWARLSSESARF